MAHSQAFPLKLSKSSSSSKWPWKIWLRRYTTRKQLKALSHDDPERLQRDLGLQATAAKEEYSKWFWQP